MTDRDYLFPSRAHVVLDSLPATEAPVIALGPTWNGWACPYFDRQGAQTVIEGIEAEHRAHPTWGLTRLRWAADGRTVEALDPEGDADEDGEPVWSDYAYAQDTPYGVAWCIGGWHWTWWVVGDDEDEDGER